MVCAASNRCGEETLQWLLEVERCDEISKLGAADARWDELDRALAKTLMHLVTGDVSRELLLYQEQQTRRGMPLKGRAAWWMILRKFRLDEGKTSKVNIKALMKVAYKGDLGQFLD